MPPKDQQPPASRMESGMAVNPAILLRRMVSIRASNFQKDQERTILPSIREGWPAHWEMLI